MTKREENRYSMYRAVDKVLSDNQSVVDGLPALAESVSDFRQTMQDISDQDNVYKTVTGGATDAKNTAEETLIETMVSLSGALSAYGRKTGDDRSRSLSQFSESDLILMRDSDLVQKGKNLLETLQQNESGLTHFGVTSAMIADFLNRLTFYEEALGRKDSKFAESKAARRKLKELFSKANEILKEEVDQMMELIRVSNSGVYNQYEAARVIKDL